MTACSTRRAVQGLFWPAVFALALLHFAPTAYGEQAARRIEEVIVTAERREASVQDTSISMSAFDSSFMSDFDIQDQSDLQNFMPSTIIQRYDAAIRGLGRTFRTLGGEPGVSVYLNGIYSEDFFTVATEGGMHDVERVEVLRGPQGVLWGRNSLGGTVLFHNKRPTNEFEAELEVGGGNFELFDTSFILSGPIIRDKLKARLTGRKRTRDGFIDDNGPGDSLGAHGNENYALAFEATPTDRITIYVRGNERSLANDFNGGAGAMSIFAGERSDDGFRDGFRNTTDLTFGFREITPGQNDPTQPGFDDPNARTFEFQSPRTGRTALAQKVRPGIDPRSPIDNPVLDDQGNPVIDPETGLPAFSQGNATAFELLPNFAFGLPESQPQTVKRSNSIDGKSLDADTNGISEERFDHQATQFNFNYAGDRVNFTYRYGYSDFTYERDTDEDFTSSTRFGTSQFFVVQEGENQQHEVQFDFNTGPVSHTIGGTFYESNINQRLDLYDPIDTQGRIQDIASLNGFGQGSDEANARAFGQVLQTLDAVGALGQGTRAINEPLRNIRTAEVAKKDGMFAGPAANTGNFTLLAPWFGDPDLGTDTSRLRSGKFTPGTHFAWSNDISTESWAGFWQADWQITPKWALSGGLRFTRDQKDAGERLIGQQENFGLTQLALFDALGLFGNPGGLLPGVQEFLNPENPNFAQNAAKFGACGDPASPDNALCLFNVVNGAVDPTDNDLEGTEPGDEPVRFTGVPIAFNIYRPFDTFDDHLTWRLNLDYTPNDNTLLYASVTTGQKSGGFNLGFNSVNNPVFDEETIIAYELGYKGQLLDNTLQLNSALYFYDQDNRQTGTQQVSGLGVSTDIINAPEVLSIGWEGDFTWLATDQATLGGNWSFTKSEFQKDVTVVDSLNPNAPQSVFTAAELRVSTGDENQQPKIPRWKGTMWAQYQWPLGVWGTFSVNTSGSFTSEFYMEPPFERGIDRAPSFWRWDAAAKWNSANRRWQVRAWVNNILNRVGVRDIEREGEELNFQRTIFTTDPRQYGLTLSFNFQGG